MALGFTQMALTFVALDQVGVIPGQLYRAFAATNSSLFSLLCQVILLPAERPVFLRDSASGMYSTRCVQAP